MRAILAVFIFVILLFSALWLEKTYKVKSYMRSNSSIELYDFGTYGVSDDVDLALKLKNGHSVVLYSVENDVDYLLDTKSINVHSIDGYQLHEVGCLNHRVVGWSDSWDLGYKSSFDLFNYRSLNEFVYSIEGISAVVSNFNRCPKYVEKKRRDTEISFRYCVSEMSVNFTSVLADNMCL